MLTLVDLREGLNNRMIWDTKRTLAIKPRMKTEVWYCRDCNKYFGHPTIEDDRYTLCPYCGNDWNDHLWLNFETRNFVNDDYNLICEEGCADMTDIQAELEYAKEEYAEDDVYTVEDWIDFATAMGGDWTEIDMDQVFTDLAEERGISNEN